MTFDPEELARILLRTSDLVLTSGAEARHRISLAYQEARDLVSQLPGDPDYAGPRIAVCKTIAEAHKTEGDPAFVGWLLVAIEEQICGQDINQSRAARDVLEEIVTLLTWTPPQIL